MGGGGKKPMSSIGGGCGVKVQWPNNTYWLFTMENLLEIRWILNIYFLLS